MNTAACYLVERMECEADEIARGLRRRDPDLLDSLIEQYQHRLLRYLISLVHDRQTAEDIFRKPGSAFSNRGTVTIRVTTS